jgi:hypothetical protein
MLVSSDGEGFRDAHLMHHDAMHDLGPILYVLRIIHLQIQT